MQALKNLVVHIELILPKRSVYIQVKHEKIILASAQCTYKVADEGVAFGPTK